MSGEPGQVLHASGLAVSHWGQLGDWVNVACPDLGTCCNVLPVSVLAVMVAGRLGSKWFMSCVLQDNAL